MNCEMDEEIRKAVFNNPREFRSGYFAPFVLSGKDEECVKVPLKDSLKLEEKKRNIAYEKHLIPYVAQSESGAAEPSSCPALKLYRKEDIGPEITNYLDRLADEVKATNDQNAALRLLDIACALPRIGDAKVFAAGLQFDFKHDILTAINIAVSHKKSLVDVLPKWASFSNSLLSEGIILLVAGREYPDITGLAHYGIHLIERSSLTDALVFAAHLLSYENALTQSLYDRWIAENKDKLPSSEGSAVEGIAAEELVQVLDERLSSLFAPQFALTETYRLVLCAMPAEDVQSRTLKSKTNSCLRKIFLASMARGDDYELCEAIVWDMASRSEYPQTKDVFLVLLKVYQMVAFADDERKSTSPLMERFKAQGVIRHLFDELSLAKPRNFMLADYSSVDDEDTIELMSVVDKILRFVRVALEKTEFGPMYEARLQAAFHITKAFFKIFVEGESVNIIPFSNTLLQPDACEKLISLISSEATKYPQRTHWYKRWQDAVNATVSVGDRGNARSSSSAAMSSAGSGRSWARGQTSHPQSRAPSSAASSRASSVSGTNNRPFESVPVPNAVPPPPEDFRTRTISQGSEATIQSTTESATIHTEERRVGVPPPVQPPQQRSGSWFSQAKQGSAPQQLASIVDSTYKELSSRDKHLIEKNDLVTEVMAMHTEQNGQEQGFGSSLQPNSNTPGLGNLLQKINNIQSSHHQHTGFAPMSSNAAPAGFADKRDSRTEISGDRRGGPPQTQSHIGPCHGCGVAGHIRRDCPSSNNRQMNPQQPQRQHGHMGGYKKSEFGMKPPQVDQPASNTDHLAHVEHNNHSNEAEAPSQIPQPQNPVEMKQCSEIEKILTENVLGLDSASAASANPTSVNFASAVPVDIQAAPTPSADIPKSVESVEHIRQPVETPVPQNKPVAASFYSLLDNVLDSGDSPPASGSASTECVVGNLLRNNNVAHDPVVEEVSASVDAESAAVQEVDQSAHDEVAAEPAPAPAVQEDNVQAHAVEAGNSSRVDNSASIPVQEAAPSVEVEAHAETEHNPTVAEPSVRVPCAEIKQEIVEPEPTPTVEQQAPPPSVAPPPPRPVKENNCEEEEDEDDWGATDQWAGGFAQARSGAGFSNDSGGGDRGRGGGYRGGRGGGERGTRGSGGSRGGRPPRRGA